MTLHIDERVAEATGDALEPLVLYGVEVLSWFMDRNKELAGDRADMPPSSHHNAALSAAIQCLVFANARMSEGAGMSPELARQNATLALGTGAGAIFASVEEGERLSFVEGFRVEAGRVTVAMAETQGSA